MTESVVAMTSDITWMSLQTRREFIQHIILPTDAFISSISTTSEPLSLYMPHQALHVSTDGSPVEAPQEYIDMFAYIESDMKGGLAAAAYSMNESIGAVVERLHSRQMLENSIIIFMSDNGGTTGTKFGIRVPAFIWSPLLNKSGYVSDAMIHVTDTAIDRHN
ncbi:unnamed protein product [Oppiella nova]|uniref:Sulfatase N-terminal domain-containing protein n=1 Tax=Oppiella nova TaxID=334625 RepID=A0A7R9QX81_9ACAR|nr:unnamed protein product [Oppiella nova]CAG2177359.1 unnamed protein product [Oppiella nova]